MDAYGFFLPLVLLSFLLLPLAQATKIRYCDHEGDYDVKVSGVKVSPNPVVSGQPATFTISASADQPITGGNLVIDVAYWGVHIHKETHSLCEKTDCPISAGKFVLSHTQKLPGITPPGEKHPYLIPKRENYTIPFT